MEIKLNIGDPKAKKTAKAVIAQENTKPFLGKKIGDKVKGDECGFPGYEFEITGGSDYCGFPMRRDVQGSMRKKILIVKGIGLRKNVPGRKVRKNVAGNTIHPNTAQVNLKVVKYGEKTLFETAAEKADEKKAE